MASTLERLTTKDPAEKLARQRLSVLQLAEEIGSVARSTTPPPSRFSHGYPPSFAVFRLSGDGRQAG
jgi:hypothetical protein